MSRLIATWLALSFAFAATAQVKVQGSFRSRLEGWDWFDAPPFDNAYAFSGNLLRVSLSGQRKTWDWQLEFAAPVLLGLPERAIAPAPQLQLGFGGLYYGANDRERNAALLFVKQGFVRFGSVLASGDRLRLGRFEFVDGTETVPSNATLAWLKRERIAHRLLGNFGWTHVGRSYDGAQYSWTGSGLNVTLLAALPTRGVFQVDGWGNLAIPIGYGALTGGTKRGGYEGEWRLFGMYYEDTRDIGKADNRPAAVRAADLENVRIGTFGGHYLAEILSDYGSFDGLFWGAAQAGSWGRLDHRGWAFAAEAGWQPLIQQRVRPWLRLGYFHSSGDNNALDDSHGTFFQVLPTARVYARFPFFNLMNSQDAFASLILRPRKTVSLRTDLHGLWLASRNDSWYQGGGAFQPWSFGYIARPNLGDRRLATLWDLSADWQATPAIQLSAYFAHAWGASVVERLYPAGSGGNLGYVEVSYRF